MKKIIEIECCSECPHSNMATTAILGGTMKKIICVFDGEEKDLPDNVLFDRIIPEWCKLESKTLTDSVTYEQITNKARELYGKDLQKRSIFIKGAIFASQPAFHEVVWKDEKGYSYAYCGSCEIAIASIWQMNILKIWYSARSHIGDVLGSISEPHHETLEEAKSAVIEAWKEFLIKIAN